MENKEKIINEQKNEAESTKNKKPTTPKKRKCACCEEMFPVEDLLPNNPIAKEFLCDNCYASLNIPFKLGFIALEDFEYTYIITNKKIKLICSHSVKTLFFESDHFAYNLTWALGDFLSNDWGKTPEKQQKLNYLTLFRRDNDIVAQYETDFGELTIITNKQRTKTKIYFSHEYQMDLNFEKNKGAKNESL